MQETFEKSLAESEETRVTRTLSEQEAKAVTVGALVGTAMEWYDFFLFNTAAALVFNVQYFVSSSPVTDQLASFATLAVGFAARPIGGLIFGAIGDKMGRRGVLLTTVVGIGVITGVIGLLPNYATIGIWAPLLLIALRLLQGIFVGGEWSGAMTLAVEHAPLAKRARYAAFPQVGSPIGTILSSGGFFLVTVLFSKHSFDTIGWRIPFLLALPLLLVAVLIRRKLDESPVFRDLQEHGEAEKAPVRATFQHSWLQLLVGASVALLGVGGFYLVTTFVVAYGRRVLHLSASLLLLSSMIAAAFEIVVILTGGRLGERFGASKVVIWGAVSTIVLAYPCFLLIETRQPLFVVIGMTIAVAALSYPYAASGTVITGLFPATTRFTGVALAQNTAGVVSGFVPMIATAWVASAHDAWWPAAGFLVLIALVTLAGGLIAPRVSVDLPGFKH